MPEGASSIWVETRTWSPARSSVPVTTTSTPASAAMVFKSVALGGEALAGRGGANHEGLQPRKRAADRIGHTEGEEIDLGVRAQHPEGQHDQPRHRPRLRAGAGVHQRQGLADLASHRRRVGIAVRRPLGDGELDDAVGGHHLGAAGQRRRLRDRDRAKDLDDGAARERGLARQHLEEDRADREQVGGGAEDLALPLLGRHVAWGPHERPRLRQRDLGSELLRHRPREPEIQQLHAVRREKDVRGLQVAVDDAPRVQGLQRRQHPQRDPERLSDRNALAGETLLECLALQQLHDEVELAALFSELVDVADVRMVDACGGPGLAQQTLAQCRVSGGIPDPLDGHVAVQAVVVGGVHHSHAALAQPPGHTVAADGFRLPRPRRVGAPGHRALAGE